MTKPASPTAEEVSELLASLPNAVEREIYTGRAAEAAGITPEAMKLEVQRSFKRRIARENRSELRKNLNPAVALQPKERSLRYENMRSARGGGRHSPSSADGRHPVFRHDAPSRRSEFSSPLLGRAYQRLWEVHAAGGPAHDLAVSGRGIFPGGDRVISPPSVRSR